MKRYLIWLCIAAASVTMTSCNLFIDNDTIDANGFENVPVHTGEGYDKPVTVKDGDATITYQYKKNVRVLTPEDQQRWIVKTEMDPTGTGYEISYRSDTPEDQLPVRGEILVSTITDKFKWGLNHMVIGSVKQDGIIKYAAVVMTIDETYEELQMDGRVTTFEEETYYTADVDNSVVELDENGFPVANDEDEGNKPEQARQTTRADDNSTEDKGIVDFTDNGFTLNLPVDKEYELELPGDISAKIDTKGSTMIVETTFDVSGFDMSQGKYNIKMTQRVDEDFKIKISGGWSGDRRIKRFQPIRGKSFAIGPVVLVLFVNIDIIIEGSVEATFFLTKSLHQTKTYDINLKNMTMDVKEDKEATGDGETNMKNPDDDGDLRLDHVIIEGNFGVFARLHVGLGFYGKLISLQVVPKIGANLNIVMPTYWDSDSETIYDISEETGITISFPFTVTLGIFWECDIDGIISTGQEMIESSMNVMLGPIWWVQKYVAEKGVDYFVSLVNGHEADYDATKVNYHNTEKDKDDNDEDDDGDAGAIGDGIYKPFGPWYPIDDIHFSWFPTMAKKSFKVVKYWDEELKEMAFKGEFKCLGIGFLGGLGIKYVPALKIYNGSEYLNTVWCDEGGKSADIKEGETYHFTIKGTTENDVMYTAVPCYYGRPLGMKQNPDALDKGLTFSATSPSIAITNVNPWRVDYGLSFADKTYYDYTFYIDVMVAMRGSLTVQKWGLEYYLGSNVTPATYDYNAKKDQKLADGTYKLKFKFEVQDATKNPYSIKVRFVPYYYGGTGTGGRHRGSEYAIKVYSNGYYRLIDPETKKEGDKIKFEAPPKHDAGGDTGPTLETDDDFRLVDALQDGRMKMTLESIEHVPYSPTSTATL